MKLERASFEKGAWATAARALFSFWACGLVFGLAIGLCGGFFWGFYA